MQPITYQSISLPKFKITICGESAVGKSTLVYHYINEGKPNVKLEPTIGVDVSIKTVELNGHKYELVFWDTAGQERFRSLAPTYFRDSHAVILVYDVTNKKSFEELNYWFETARTNCNRMNILFALVGNKVDFKNEIVIDKNKADKFANEKNIKISYQVSAFTGQNVYHLFDTLSSELSSTFSDYLSSFGNSNTHHDYNLPQSIQFEDMRDESQNPVRSSNTHRDYNLPQGIQIENNSTNSSESCC